MPPSRTARRYAADPGRPEGSATIGARISAHRGRAPHTPARATTGLAPAVAKRVGDDVESGANTGATPTRVAPTVRLVVFALLVTAACASSFRAQAGSDPTTTSVNEARVDLDGPADATPINDSTKDRSTMNETTGTGLKPHPLAELLPQLEGEEFAALVADIKANGLLEPITTYQDMVLDGRARDRACGVAGVVPETREFTGPGSPAAFIIGKNVLRRHLDESQRAMFAARLKKEFEEEARLNMSRGGQGGLADSPTLHSRDRAAEAVNVSSRLVGSSEKVLKDGVPELAEAVERGQVAVSAAAEVAKLPPEVQSEVVAQGPDGVRDKAAAIRRAKEVKKPKGSGSEPATVAVAEPTASPLSTTDEDRLPDKEWLERLPIRSQLSPDCRAMFDREALYWRRLDELNAEYFRRLNELDGRFCAEGPDSFVGYLGRLDEGPLHADIQAKSLLFPNHPDWWETCESCDGRPDSEDDEPCETCDGVGFYGPPKPWINLYEQQS